MQTVAGDSICTPSAMAATLRRRNFHPSAVALDTSGNLYVAETGAQRIRMVSVTGQIATLAGTGVAG